MDYWMMDDVQQAERHDAALADTGGEAYTVFHGWRLDCLWCSFVATGNTKREAAAKIGAHLDGLHELLEADRKRRSSYTDEQLDELRTQWNHKCVRSPQCSVPEHSYPSGVRCCPRCNGYLPEFGTPK